MKILICGTPSFAVSPFREIINNFNVVGVVTQPDRKANRGQKLIASPVKLLAQQHNIPLFQPLRMKEIYYQLKNIDFDLIVTCAYGQIIPSPILKLAKTAAINIHASLLPKYRGASPIHYALLNNDKKTGISLIYMTNKMDAGDVIVSESILISPQDTIVSLFNRLSIVAAKNIVEWIRKIETRKIFSKSQDENSVTFAPKLSKDFFTITANKSIDKVLTLVNKFSIQYPVKVKINNQLYKIIEARAEKPNLPHYPFDLADGMIYITKIQPPNKKPMSVESFLRGNQF